MLCELKFINACKTRYPRDPRPRNEVRAVERRAEGLTDAYAKTAWQRQGWRRQTPCLVKLSFSSPRQRKWLVKLAFSAKGSPLQLFKAKLDFFWIGFNC